MVRESLIPQLFLVNRAPHTLYILNDKIQVFEELPSEFNVHYPYKAFSLLLELFSYPEAKKNIPKELHEALVGSKKPDFWEGFHCLAGTDQKYDFSRLCLDAEMSISREMENYVTIKNITLEKKRFNFEINLPFNDVFYILSNICVQGYFPHLEHYIETDLFDKKRLLEENFSYIEKHHGLSGFLYCIEFLDFVKNSLLHNTLRASYILKTNGVATLGFLAKLESVKTFIDEILLELQKENIPKIKKIINYTLIHHLNYWSDIKISEEQQILLNQFKQNLHSSIKKFER